MCRSVNHTFQTPKWEWDGMKDYYADYRREMKEIENETMREFVVWDYDEGNHSWSTMATFKYPESEPFESNTTR